MKKLFIIAVMAMATGCSNLRSDTFKSIFEYGIDSEDYVHWSANQQITWDLFEGEPDEQGIYYNYFGLYFFYDDIRNKFNATVYFDKGKSWVKPKQDWGESIQFYEQAPKLLKMKFDFYECKIRELRKYLIENEAYLGDKDTAKEIAEDYFKDAEYEWKKIQAGIHSNYSTRQILNTRKMIDEKLTELEAFDARVNDPF